MENKPASILKKIGDTVKKIFGAAAEKLPGKDFSLNLGDLDIGPKIVPMAKPDEPTAGTYTTIKKIEPSAAPTVAPDLGNKESERKFSA